MAIPFTGDQKLFLGGWVGVNSDVSVSLCTFSKIEMDKELANDVKYEFMSREYFCLSINPLFTAILDLGTVAKHQGGQ